RARQRRECRSSDRPTARRFRTCQPCSRDAPPAPRAFDIQTYYSVGCNILLSIQEKAGWMTDDYAGLRVLDVSQGFAGPCCGAIPARGGASVVKAGPPAGDWARTIGGSVDGHTAFSIVPNIGKRAICIDGTGPDGRKVLAGLAASADIVIQNFRPGVVE